MSGEALFTRADLENRLNRTTVARIFDDANDGDPSEDALGRLIADGTSTVWAFLPTGYELPDDPDNPGQKLIPPYLQKLALDVAQGTAYTRHPEFNRSDGHELLKMARAELRGFKHQLTRDEQVPRTDVLGAVFSRQRRDRSWVRR